MKRITSNDDLIPGEWYWRRMKGGARLANGNISEPGEFSAKKVTQGHWKAIGDMWCDNDNDQALGMYDIYGPIPLPVPNFKVDTNKIPIILSGWFINMARTLNLI